MAHGPHTKSHIDGLSWDDLRVLQAVAHTGSLSRAAAELGLTQPTVGRRLDRLEQALGVPVVRRTSQGCHLTDRGGALLPMIERMQAAAEGVQRVAASASNELEGVVRVALGPLMARHVARHLPWLLGEAPRLRLEVLAGMDFVRLERGDADLAMRTRAPEGDDWVARPMPPSRYAAYGSRAYADAHPEACTDARWERCRWVSFPAESSSPSAQLLRTLRGPPPEVGLSSSLLVVEAVAAGTGLGLLPTWCGDDDPRLERLSEPIDDFGIGGFLVVHPSARRLERVRWVARRLTELFSTHSD